MVKAKTKMGLLMGFGSVFVVTGAIMVIFWPTIFISQLRRMMVLTKESMSFEIWREVPIPMYLECHLFNITNVDEILAGKADKVHVVEMGPYVFRETHTKVNMTWNNENSTITYLNQRWWYYVPEMSNGSLSDNVTTINPIIATIAYQSRHRSWIEAMGMDVVIRVFHSNMFLTANVSSWLFDGIEDRLLDAALIVMPSEIPYDKFGWFYTRNGSETFDGVFNMNTGAEDFSMLGDIQEWQYSNRTVYRDRCGKVHGSTGELWAPEFGQEEVVIFASDICTSLTLHKNGSVNVEGIDGVLYAANNSVFDNGHNYPEMACYCDEVRNADCMPPGALNVSECRFGAPAFVSLPHFLHSDPHYPRKIEGLNPTPGHNFRLGLEMFTGMPLQVFAQLQVNLLVRRVTGLSIINQLPDPDTLVPMFWFRQEVGTTPEYAALARQALRLRYWIPYGMYALTVIGVLLLIGGIVILVRKTMTSPETSPIMDDEATVPNNVDSE